MPASDRGHFPDRLARTLPDENSIIFCDCAGISPAIRIDLQIEVPAVEYRDISSTRAEEDSAAVRDRVGRARERQQARFRSDKRSTAMRGWGRARSNNVANSAMNHRN